MLALWILLATLIAYIFHRAATRPSLFPPGPLSLPLIGSTLSILPSPKVSFKKFQKKYGDICGFKVFKDWVVLVSDPTLIRTTGVDYKFSGRPPIYLFTARNVIISGNEESLGIIGTSGDVWKHQRRFTLRSLKDQGFGRNSIEPIMQSELEELGDYFAGQANGKISVGNTFNRSVVNVLWAMIIGRRFSYDDVRLQVLVDKVNKMLQSFDPFSPALNLPIIKKLFPNLEVFRKCDGYMKDILEFIEDQIAVHEKAMEDHDEPECYAGHYLKEIKERQEAAKETPLNRYHLQANIIELFVAGSETTSSTLCWAVYLLASNPEVQQKMQAEIDCVIGQGNILSLNQIDSLPYTNAVIYEIQRIADLVPYAVPHKTMDDTTIGGYRLPKGTDILYNISHVMKSPKYWKHPDKFYPEHFLTDDGKAVKPDIFMPFGYGKRVCLGESLARLELFFFVTNLFHRFYWKMSEDPVKWEEATMLTRPPNFSVYITPRDEHQCLRII